MKILFSLLTLLSLNVQAVDSEKWNGLDGFTYCRDVEGGLGTPPNTKSQHCVSFADGQMTDNANTFFGNPSETIRIKKVNEVIINADTNEATAYRRDHQNGKWVIIYNDTSVMNEVDSFDRVVIF